MNDKQPPLYAEFLAFRKRFEDLGAGYRITVRAFDPQLEKTLTYEAALWGDIEDAP